MPESVKDRPTKSHENIFMLTKSEQYYYKHTTGQSMYVRINVIMKRIPVNTVAVEKQ
jgi:hypothetical protein